MMMVIVAEVMVMMTKNKMRRRMKLVMVLMMHHLPAHIRTIAVKCIVIIEKTDPVSTVICNSN